MQDTTPYTADMTASGKTGGILGIVTEMPVAFHDGRISIHMSFGRIIDALAQGYEHVLLCAPTLSGQERQVSDYILKSANIELVPQPMYGSSLSALRYPGRIIRAYADTLRRADHVFVRGMPPYSGALYMLARRYRRKPVHWIVGNAVALLKSHRRSNRLKDALALAYAYQDRAFTRWGRRTTGGAFICNGNELAEVYASPRTTAVVSTTITRDEFFEREDTCGGDTIRMLFIGFIRPEKGLEYLIEALPKLRFEKPWRLTIVGSHEQYESYNTKIHELADRLGVADRIDWEGYVTYGPDMWEYLRRHDIFVLPTLSEGTPRVLVEARANSLPVVATNVGGIPTSVTNGVDGMLVPAKDPDALAEAINRIAADSDFRQKLIASGLKSVRKLTVECFAESVMAEL